MTTPAEGTTTPEAGQPPSILAPPANEGLAATLDRVQRELGALDLAVYDAVSGTPSPTIDAALAGISNAANHARLWLVTAGVLSLFGRDQRRAALVGVAAVGATSAVGNLAIKPALSRGRPQRTESSRTQRVRMPKSHSFPSGHTASAFAFSSAVGGELPFLSTPLRLMATTVAYSRVHTGVHYPGDVVIGALVGAGMGTATRLLARRAGISGR
jgi:membrane-associated phospholipid phosphatase